MVRKQNERTILLQYRIIPLSLPTNSILSYFSTPCPLSSRLGAFSFPRDIFPQIFSEIFSNLAKATFCWIFGAKNYGGRRHLSLPKWGGVSLFVGSLYIVTGFYPLRHSRSPPSLHKDKKASNQVKKGQKWNFSWLFLSTPRNFGDNERQKPNIFLKRGFKVGAGCGSACLPFGVSTGGRCAISLCYFADVSKNE